MAFPNWIDRLVMAVSPERGMRRLAARNQAELWQRRQERFARIEASEANETRGNRWLISRLSPDSQLETDLQTARDRARDVYQNDATGGIVDSKVNHVIGVGHTPQARLVADEVADAEELNEQIEKVYRDWSPRADRTGYRSLWMLSRLAERHNCVDGESLTILSDVGRADKPIPLAVQVIDPERLETPPERSGDPLTRLGIEYDADGQIVAYHVRRVHSGDTKASDWKFDRLPAERVLHVFEPWFAEQSRGLPWMVRTLNRVKDAKDYDESQIIAAQIEACFSLFVESPISGYQAALGAATGSNDTDRLQDIAPGRIQYLNPGEKITSSAPQRPGSGFAPFMEWNYRRVAAAINWPYEMVVKNWNGLSFAAGRLVLTDAKKSTQVGQRIMREMWFERIWQRMVYEAVTVQAIEADPVDFLLNPTPFYRHVWIAPRWDYALNPGEEVTADVEEINANLLTLEDALGKRGYDMEEFIARRKREKELLETAGLSATIATPQPGRPPEGEDAPADDEQPADETEPEEVMT